MSLIKFLWWTVFLHTSFESHHPNVTIRREAQVQYECHLQQRCVWRDENNYTYNLTLLNKWFRVRGSKYNGTWFFGYNPCKWHWRGGDCNKKNMTAICRWPTVGNKSDEFRSIGNGNPRCTIRHGDVYLKYTVSHGEYRNRSSTVILKCDEDRVHKKFRVTNEDSNWKFELHHKHACGVPPDIPDPPGGGNLAGYVGYVAVSVVGGCLFLVFAGRLVRGKYNTNNNNGNNEEDDDRERAPLRDNEAMIYNAIEEPNLESRSRPVPIPNIRNKNQATFQHVLESNFA